MGVVSFLAKIPYGSPEYQAASEQLHQIAFLEFLRLRYPPLASVVFAIPNGGSRNKVEASKMKLEGVRAGVPDLFIPYPFNGKHGLYLEFKNMNVSARPSEKQVAYISLMRKLGYDAWCVHGWAQGRDAVMYYLAESMNFDSGFNAIAQLNDEYRPVGWKPAQG